MYQFNIIFHFRHGEYSVCVCGSEGHHFTAQSKGVQLGVMQCSAPFKHPQQYSVLQPITSDHPSKIQLGFGDNNQTNQKHSSVPDFRNSLVLALKTISIN